MVEFEFITCSPAASRVIYPAVLVLGAILAEYL